MKRNRLLSARKVEGLVADGRLIVIYEGYALNLDSWIDRHPGGRLAILHMVGRDATDEIKAYHFTRTLHQMKAFRIGRIQQPWTNLQPPIRGGCHRRTTEADVDTDDSSTSSSSSARDAHGAESPLLSAEDTTRLLLENGNGAAAKQNGIAHTTTASTPLCPQSASKMSRRAFATALEEEEFADGTRNFPSVDIETQQAIREEYDALHKLVQERGYYNCPYSEYGKEMIRYALLFAAFLYLLRAEWYILSAVCLGFFWQQIMFTAHDAGHRGITGHPVIDLVIGAFIGDFCCGLSLGWWKASHNVHHLVTNMPEHDPDVQYVPVFSISPSFFKSIASTFYSLPLPWDRAADLIIPYQKYLYYPIMAVARFNLYFLSWYHLLSPHTAQFGAVWWVRYLELTFLTGYWALFGYALVWRSLPDWPTRVVFVLVSHAVTMVLHVQINLSHWGMPTTDLGPTESFAQRQLRTTMDVECPPWLDFLHGGLQFQAVHHLFPRVPRHNLRKCQELVRSFSARTGIKYSCLGFVEGNKVVLSRLEEVARMVDMLVQCQMHEVDEYAEEKASKSPILSQ